ncbi:MAG TPA: hypothetical protein VGP07_20890, partial [Polyangia bacterium]
MTMKFGTAVLFGSALVGFAASAVAQTPAPVKAPAAAPAPAPMKAPAPAMKAPAPAAAPAAAPATPAAPAGPDMTKVGPMSRKVTKEDKKGVSDTFKAWDDGWKKGDVNALAEMVDFPIIMMSDSSKGEEKHFEATREQFIGMMQGVANMPKDMKMTAKRAPTFISDSLVVTINTVSMTMGKIKGSWHGFDVLALKDGKWKFKQICEAGWGDMAPGAAPAPAPMMAAPAAPHAAPKAPAAKPAMAPAPAAPAA